MYLLYIYTRYGYIDRISCNIFDLLRRSIKRTHDGLRSTYFIILYNVSIIT